jgi:hypothetical protein
MFKPLIRAIIKENIVEIRRCLSYINVYQSIPGPLDSPEVIKEPVYAKPVESIPFFENLINLVLKLVRKKYNKVCSDEIRPTGQSVAITPVRTGSYAQYVACGLPGSPLDHQITSLLYMRELADDPLPLMFQGNLKIIGDSGGKSRLILVGFPPVQAKLRSLQLYLLDILRHTPTDCTFDQESGHRFVVQNQLSGKPLWSIDLKDATWHFPMSLQSTVLKGLGASEFLQYFDLPISDDGKLIKVLKGQAMGLMPSFPLFSLTHNLLLTGLCKWIGIVPFNSFRVLGDDLIIANERLKNLYMSWTKVYQIPVSHHKCLSGHAAEFAGKIFFKGYDVTPIRWRRLGKESLSSLFHQYKSILGSKVYDLICDWSAFWTLSGLPRSVGGLGLSQDKYPITSRILKIRLGIVTSMIENFGQVKATGTEVKDKQYEYSGTNNPTPWYLRALGSHVSVPLVCTQYGFLPYLGNPFRTSQQLKLEIPLLPKHRPKGNPSFGELSQLFLIKWRYLNGRKGQTSRKEIKNQINRAIDDLCELKRGKTHISSKEAPTTKEVDGKETSENCLGHYVPTLFYE